ncbi:MAG: hypothetical protein Tsb0034_11630 [Ekhidna sp.]
MNLKSIFFLRAIVFSASVVVAFGQESRVRSIEINKGQVISLITSKPLPGTDELRSEYFRNVFPPAQALGFESQGSFRIRSVKLHGSKADPHVGEGNLMSFFTWPDGASIERFRRETPNWNELEKSRRDIWEELRIIRMTSLKNAELNFHSDKIYRIVFVWLNDENPEHLKRYQKAMKATREELGARYVIQWDKVDYYHSFIEPSNVPDLAWIIEWPSSQAHDDYLASEAFSKNVQLFMSGVSRFEAYETEFLFGN